MKSPEGFIPDKLYFRIGEVSDITGVKPYVLRYWESEFQDIHPTKSKSGQRLYKRRDVEVLMAIRKLLYEERFTINGARKRLKEIIRGGEVLDAPVKMETALDDPETGEPRQLEAFPTAEELPSSLERVASNPGTAAPDNRKVFVKLKKDLQSLLQELKS